MAMQYVSIPTHLDVQSDPESLYHFTSLMPNQQETNTVAQLVIPKHHGAKLLDIPAEDLSEILPVAQRIAKASGAENYNILQNNGRLAHQEVDHVHFHFIPKPNQEEGLQVGWPQQKGDMDKLKKLMEEIKAKM